MDDLPELVGRTSADPRAAADVILLGEKEPLLAVWGFGLGRVAAYTADSKLNWSRQWVQWKGFSTFWVRVLQEVIRPPQVLNLEIRPRQTHESAAFLIRASDEAGKPVNDLKCTATIEALSVPNLATTLPASAAALQWKHFAPGEYQALLDFPTGGTRLVSLFLQRPGQKATRYCSLLTSPPNPEDVTGPDVEALHSIAAAGHGQFANEPAAIASAIASSAAPRLVSSPLVLWPVLLIITICLWPLDLLLRRLL